MDTSNAGIYFLSFIIIVTLVGMGSIVLSIIFDKDTIEPLRFSENHVTKPKVNFEIDYLQELSKLQDETYDVIINDQ